MNTLELPPTEKGRNYELRARNLRQFAGLRRDDLPLDPFALARLARIVVVNFDEIQGLSKEAREHLLGEGADDWSGGACSRELPDGRKLVILNPKHGKYRHHATLMEEICHVMLGHQANRLSVAAEHNGGKTLARDYNAADEEEAYAVGAAALVPFTGLKRFVLAGKTAMQIARIFNVSRELVTYRMKVSLLWPEYRQRHPEEIEQYSRRKSSSENNSG